MTREDELAVKSDVGLAGPTGNEFELGQTPVFELRLRTEGELRVASGLAVTDFHFHSSRASFQGIRGTRTEESRGGKSVAQQRAKDDHLRTRCTAIYM